MLSVKRLLVFTVLGAILAMFAIPSLADTRQSQFVVMVQVLPHCQWSLPPEADNHARLTIACTRDTGYSVSLARAGNSMLEPHASGLSGVGSGALQVLPLVTATADSPNAGVQNAAPLFLTINY
ncbi:MAG: hypothetical protein KGL98_03410 [Gammaproteobacteria bacterium]|nr:hypothetical protein [Gammaproteobacteria bacterium]MDE2460273.1 hypothetical protein [Gammaproteobacteria bacterium]